jgi:hypothetical protein
MITGVTDISLSAIFSYSRQVTFFIMPNWPIERDK